MKDNDNLVTAAEPIISWMNKCNIDTLADIADNRGISYRIEDGKIKSIHKE